MWEWRRTTGDYEKMTNEELVSLIQSGQQGKDNMFLLWKQNQGIIYKIAKRYSGYAERDDLMQEGYLGLCKAVRHYDADQCKQFVGYAVFWIRQVMQRYIDNSCGVVRLPVHAQTMSRKYKKVLSEYRKYYGRDPSDREMASFLEVSAEKLESIKQNAKMGKIRSLNEPIETEDGGVTLEDTVQSSECLEDDCIRRIDFQSMRQELWEAVDGLGPERSNVMRCRFLDGNTMKEISERCGITLSETRTVHDNALRELRKPSRSRRFRGYYEEHLAACCYHHVGVATFNTTWTSEVEREVLGYSGAKKC